MFDPSASTDGQRDLGTLLKTMSPILRDEEYVFCFVSEDGLASLPASPLGMFREPEGITAILTVQEAQAADLPVEPRWRMITLSVHSDLQAVGFLAAMTQALAAANISVNAISAYFHDHLFVPTHQAEAAMECLGQLSHRS